MGKLIKNHLARLIVLTAAAYQVAASLEGFFWPKVFWDFRSKLFDDSVKLVPILQVINMLCGLSGLAYEWPLKFIGGSALHRSIEFRIFLFPTFATAGVLMYQSTNAALYYLIGTAVYFWAYSDGEVVCGEPWTLPKRNTIKGENKV